MEVGTQSNTKLKSPHKPSALDSTAQAVLSPKVQRALLVLISTLVVSIYLLISLGGLVRNAGAGLSCPDWPLCHGELIPAEKLLGQETHAAGTPVQIFLEWFHRLIAGGVSVGLLVVSVIVFANSTLRKSLGKFAAVAITLLTAQVVLGGLTVLGLLSPKWVVSHLIVGVSFFLTLLWMRLEAKKLFHSSATTKNAAAGKFALVAFGIVFLQTFLGGLVSSNYAGLACLDFPLCNGQLIPPFEGLVKFQFLHRLGALISTIAVVAFYMKTSKAALGRFAFFRHASLALLSVQVCLGIGMIFYQLPLLMSVAHLGVACALLASLLIWIHAEKNELAGKSDGYAHVA